MRSIETKGSSARALSLLGFLAIAACAASVPPTPSSATPAAPAPAAEPPPAPVDRAQRLEKSTRNVVDSSVKGDFQEASRDFGDAMTRALPPATLARTWSQITAQAGDFSSIASVTLAQHGDIWTDEAMCKFARADLVFQVTYDVDDKIIGLHVMPATPPAAAWTAPPYVDPSSFTDRQVTVGTAHPLPGVLSLPNGVQHPPVVILVHGSGPNDEDETVGGVRVFRDLAGGLATKGIAVLRYKKRTAVDPSGVVTQREEVLDAVADALTLVKQTPELDARRVFVAGHSQGAYLGPRIAREHPGLAGLVMLAGPAEPMQDSILEQLHYLASLSSQSASALAPQIAAATEAKRKIESPTLKADESIEVLGSTVQGAYFLDVRGYDPVQVATSIDCPMLILQGERDYQVPMTSFAHWKRALVRRKNVTFHSYPALNHLFEAGQGPPSPAEYAAPGHVDGALVSDLAAWVLAQPAR